MARPFSAVLLASLLLPLASAGSPEDPEISDPAGDAEIPVSTTAGAQDALDLTAVWLAEDGDRLLFQWQVVALAESGPLDRFEYALYFESPVGPAHVEAWRQLGDSIQGAGLWVGDEMPCAHTSFDGAQPATLAFDAAASTVSLDLPKSCLLGDATASNQTLTALQAYTGHCGLFRPGNVCESEYTNPDTAEGGRPFAFTAPAGNQTVGTDEEAPSKDSPSPSVALLAAGLAVAVALAGRRRGP